LRLTIRALEEQPWSGIAALVAGVDVNIAMSSRRWCMGIDACGAVAAEVDDRRLELAKLAQQIERLGGPSGHQIEAVAEAAAFQLALDRAHLAIEREAIGAERIGGQEQNSCASWAISAQRGRVPGTE
jgi:hypothetical protein